MRNIKRYSISVLVMVSAGFSAKGQDNTWTVREYGGSGGSDCGCYLPNEAAKTIVLTQNPGADRELKFEVYWADAGGNYVSEAPLNDFTIDAAVDQDTIEISIVGDPNTQDPVHAYGASSIARMNIRDGNFGVCVLNDLRISGTLGESGPIYAGVIAGAVDVNADVLDDIAIQCLTGSVTCPSLISTR